MSTLRIKRIGDHTLTAPAYASDGDAGLDLRAAEAVTIWPGERRLVSTGFAFAIPAGHVGLVHPRSGLAAKQGVTVLNTPGTIDSGYRGEVKVLLLNTSNQPFIAAAGDRIAQLVIQEYVTVTIEEADELDTTSRGAGGFGSTGVS
ncbi:dUTP diphosphatase [Curtobacterium sp. MCSS17_016]|uniref:dUTP diphosphatase n=1 Tax=Curtobacterium sp. MCSS17_016 TaxID=2175644 RepID=UPI000DA912AB|nr:dUTP diphosphatase [Curtobacterium sp. MCSS17_016]WIE81183.1 dUTP diphosphatase [Curtobacterium sp. MCSS17_016]